ncbi:unnamed protein product [Peronospora belbahrii]|uniref:Glycosylphosphatidylinositol anchor biosynthesis protein 11 n=1 Tax=Peronospora belbahrii TaxID=622444 RepID=A0AAU9KLC2_9STRA|nr:unnamed protein product [Peronospora belbahrii]CAH0518852.1 unnamed protein product [Peronospora belbahrii]
METFLKSLQLVVPGIITRYLPILLFGQHLENAVVGGLVPVVAAIVGFLMTSNLLILHFHDQFSFRQLPCGFLGLVLGTAIFHVSIVLFGAPVVDLWMQTLLLAVVLSACTTMPLALHFGCAPRKWLDLLLTINVTNTQELYLVCSSIGAILGAYVGALPIPLDWDRPWQQWPLTCVYGILLGHAAGILVSVVVSSISTSLPKSTKKE